MTNMRYAKQVCPVPRALNLGIPSNFPTFLFPKKISQILGKPSHEDWPDAKRLADRKLYTMPEHGRIPLQNVIPRASPDAIRLMETMLSYNPKKRPKPS